LPLLRAWQERATTDATIIAAWWRQWPTAGVGIATGAASNAIVADIDDRHGGYESLRHLEREHGEIPPTWRCLTANGGLHLYFRHPGGTVGNRAGLWPGIDLRGDGGYVVAPPTQLDPDRRYVWEVGYGPHELPLADAPTWLLDALHDQQRDGHNARPTDEWAALVREGVGAGERNAAVARLTGYLLRCRPDPYVVLELLRVWNGARCRPPLPDDEVVATVDSICGREARRRAG
jgi:hypothetical protein